MLIHFKTAATEINAGVFPRKLDIIGQAAAHVLAFTYRHNESFVSQDFQVV